MGKVDLAFDQIKTKAIIQELSVVMYTDSFFYGLWNYEGTLLKTGYHPTISLDAVLRLASYNYNLTKVNLMSTVRPFVHLSEKHHDTNKFDIYFQGLYSLDRLSDHNRVWESFRHEDINTLHYMARPHEETFSKYGLTPDVAHISTSMARYISKERRKMICHVTHGIMHVCVQGDKGFLFYNQFRCYYEEDYLYYIALIVEAFFSGDDMVAVSISGDIEPKGSIFQTLRKYFRYLEFIDMALILPKEVSTLASHFYDLHLCQKCVS